MTRLLLLLRLAFRNVRRQIRRSVLTASAMVLGLAVLVFSRTIAEGAHEDWIDVGVRLGSGHIALQHPAFQASRAIEDHLTAETRATAEQALAAPAVAPYVTTAAPRIVVQGLANSPTAALPVAIFGVDPAVEKSLTILDEKLVEGRYLEPGDRLHAYIGQKLAQRLRLDIGSRLVLTAQDAQGEIAGQLVRVTGIFRMGLPEADEGIIQIPITTAQEWLAVGDGITTLAVVLESSRPVEQVVAALTADLANGEPADRRTAGPRTTDNGQRITVLGWREAMPELDAAVRIDDYGDYVFHFVLFLIVALAIVNTVLMSVLYRVREFGVVRALGLTKVESGLLVFLEGVLLTALSGFVGLVLGLSVTWIFFRDGLDFSFLMKDTEFTFSGVVLDPVIIPDFRLAIIIQSVLFIIVIGLLSSLYPAYRATRIDVAESMKFEA